MVSGALLDRVRRLAKDYLDAEVQSLTKEQPLSVNSEKALLALERPGIVSCSEAAHFHFALDRGLLNLPHLAPRILAHRHTLLAFIETGYAGLNCDQRTNEMWRLGLYCGVVYIPSAAALDRFPLALEAARALLNRAQSPSHRHVVAAGSDFVPASARLDEAHRPSLRTIRLSSLQPVFHSLAYHFPKGRTP